MQQPDKTTGNECSTFVREFCDGNLDEEMSREMSRLVDKIRAEAMQRGPEHKIKGDLTLKLKFTGECHGGRDVTVDTRYEITRKEPKPVRAGEMFFIAKGGRLSKQPPRQVNMFDTITANQESEQPANE